MVFFFNTSILDILLILDVIVEWEINIQTREIKLVLQRNAGRFRRTFPGSLKCEIQNKYLYSSPWTSFENGRAP